MQDNNLNSFDEFYLYYLSQHSKSGTKICHFIGTGLAILNSILFCVDFSFIYFLLIPISGYGFAWFGHFFFEKNHPATFRYPMYSLQADFLMFWHIIIGKVKIIKT